MIKNKRIRTVYPVRDKILVERKIPQKSGIPLGMQPAITCCIPTACRGSEKNLFSTNRGCLISRNSLPQRTQRIFTKNTKCCYTTHFICTLCVNFVLFVVKKTYETAPKISEHSCIRGKTEKNQCIRGKKMI